MGIAFVTDAGMHKCRPFNFASPPSVAILVIGDALQVILVVLDLIPVFGYTWPQAGGYKVVQGGYELLVDQEFYDGVPSASRTLRSTWSRNVRPRQAAQNTLIIM